MFPHSTLLLFVPSAQKDVPASEDWGQPCKNRLRVSAPIFSSTKNPIHCSALKYSGSEQNLIHPDLLEQYHLSSCLLDPPITSLALDGSPMTSVTYQTQPVSLIISGNHHESTKF